MTKVVINKCFGGFGLSHDAIMKWSEYSGVKLYPQIDAQYPSFGYNYYTDPDYNSDSYWSKYDLRRDDPALVRVVEEMGIDSWGDYAELKVVEIPDDVSWYIHEYDGSEAVYEEHRSWG